MTKNIVLFLLSCVIVNAQNVTSLLVNTNGAVLAPTNFWNYARTNGDIVSLLDTNADYIWDGNHTFNGSVSNNGTLIADTFIGYDIKGLSTGLTNTVGASVLFTNSNRITPQGGTLTVDSSNAAIGSLTMYQRSNH